MTILYHVIYIITIKIGLFDYYEKNKHYKTAIIMPIKFYLLIQEKGY